MGAVRGELRHSNFLAYLLSPRRPHGLGTKPLAAVLRATLERVPPPERPIRVLELIAGQLDDAIVYREKDNIDILIELPTLNFVVAIENKIDAKAGKGQLEQYATHLATAFPRHRKLLVFLTPGGSEPDFDHYVAYDYADLVSTLEGLIGDTRDLIPESSLLIVRHYIEMVRRHIVQDDELRSLAITLYERYKEAFDFVFECRPEPQNLLSALRERVLSVQGLIEDSRGSNLFRFLPEIWDEQLINIKGDPMKWSKTRRGILFEVQTYPSHPGRVSIALIVGPGDPEMRSRVHQAAGYQRQLFTGYQKYLGAQFVSIFRRDLLTEAQARDLTFEAQELNVGLAWSDFQGRTLNQLADAVIEIDKRLGSSDGGA